MNLSGQDWEPVVFRAKRVDPKAKDTVQHALRTGKPVDTVYKDKTREDRERARKLEADLDPKADSPALATLPTLNPIMRKSLVEARTKKGLTQVQLANQLNVRPQVIQDLENGKVVHEKDVLTKIRKVLGVSLKFGPQ